jgi:hypothetical protein
LQDCLIAGQGKRGKTMMPSNSIILFYEGQLPNAAWKIEDIWNFNDDELEGYHTYIQWLFPLTEPSAINFAAPILDDDVISRFRESPDLQKRLMISFKLMLKFYGFEIDESNQTIHIVKSSDYEVKKNNWISYKNHNYLRITRILTCLRLLGLENYSQALFKCLEQVYSEESYEIGEITFDYWKRSQIPDNY